MIRIEFYGIPRQRTGVPFVDVDADSLGTALTRIAERFPEFGQQCLNGDRLADGLIANLNGEEFTTNPAAVIHDGDSLLILSADVGG